MQGDYTKQAIIIVVPLNQNSLDVVFEKAKLSFNKIVYSAESSEASAELISITFKIS